ncbi:MAG: hypothetical protein AAEJ47_00655 [Planctomycetota bacterium]
MIPNSSSARATRVRSRAPIVLHRPEVTPSPRPVVKPLPALRTESRRERRDLLGTVTITGAVRDSNRSVTRLLKPSRPTRDLIDRIARPRATAKPGVGTLTKPFGPSLTPSSRKPGGIVVGSVPAPLPPFPSSGGTVTQTGGMPVTSSTCAPVPWWCQPYYNTTYYGSHWGHYGPVWNYPWVAGWCSPWYLLDPTPWCHSWALPWACYSSYNLVWWHHGYWRNHGAALVWTSRYWGINDYSSYSEPIIVYASEDEEDIAEAELVDREQFRASLCDGFHLLSQGDPVGSLPLFDSALEGLSDVGMPWLLRSVARLLCDDIEGAEADLTIALELDPSLLAVRWQEDKIFAEEIDSVRERLWSGLEVNPDDASAALMLGTLALLSESIPDAPARGAISEVLLVGEGNAATVLVHGALRGETPDSLSPAAAWLEDPDCSGLLQAIP